MEDHLAAARAALAQAVEHIAALPSATRIEALNEAKRMLHAVSPFAAEPVDCVLWVSAEAVSANDYNPNTVAPPEMRLLELSIVADGYTQPIVAARENDELTVVDGFHRNLVGRASEAVKRRTGGYLPVACINAERDGRADRIASTIRHNRARGKHGVSAMSAIVVELARRNWSDEKIAKQLGMDADEVLRLKQISGLAEMFGDREFSEAWEIDEAALCRT